MYQVKVKLNWSDPLIWRRILVRGDIKLDRLHKVIQIVMGWTDSHMHQFIGGKGSSVTYYGTADPGFINMRSTVLDEERYTLANLAPAARRKIIYEYDFGDSWEHELTVEKILPPDPSFKHSVCLAGAMACPPEDCGGIQGFSNLLASLADPKAEDHEELKDWLGESFDPAEFHLERVNADLAKYKL